ncbi:Ig-like domain-containing protein [Candidatus Palauibacter sp.]|uniref:Ig-like domain-containing protein n=1 Tax=Candidatus Palauibacter sp. TaxID=3101350 RepID=UPI003B58EF18
MAEGATGHFEVSVEGSTADGAVKVKYSVSGTAVSGEDYKALSGEATVAKGENTARIALEALDDGILDKGETVVLALTGATGPGTVVVDGTAATAMIADEGTVTIALAAVSDTIGEGSVWSSAVTMSTPVANRVSIRWWTSDGTAVAGRDYVAADEVVSFQPGETTKPVAVRTLQDDNAEPVETFLVSVGPPGGVSGASGGINFGGAQSAFIECSVDFSPPDPRVFMLTLKEEKGKFIPVKAGTVIGTVSANTTDGIPYYELGGADKNKFSINSLTAEITAAVALAADLYDLEVTVHDECGAMASVDVSVLVKQPNRPPAGETMPPNSVDVGKTKTVDASEYFSDPDGDVLTYTAKSSDATVLKVSVSGSEVTYTGKAEGSATVTVTAEDPDGLSASQSFQVKVNKPNDPPDADAGDDQTVDEGERVDLDGTKSSDSDGTIDEWEWKGPVALTDEDTSTPHFTAPTEGVTKWYTFTLEVKDNDGATDSDSVTIKVVPPVCKITVENGDFTVPENKRVVLKVGVTAEHCGTLDYELSGTGAEDVSAAAVSSRDPNAEITGNFDYEHRELYDLTLTVRERNGSASGAGSVDIEVTNVNEQPTVDNEITDQTLYVGERPNEEVIELLDVFSDPDGDPLTYTAKSSNTAVATATVNGSTLTVTAKGKGEATVTVTAKDPGDLTAVDAFDVEVPNRVPEVENAIPDQRLYVGDPPNKADIELSEVFGDPDGDKLGYTAKSSDPTVATATVSGASLTVEATGKGLARVTVTADDRMGGITEDVFEVRVPNRKPKPKGTIPDDAIDVGESRSVDVLSKFEDPDGDDLDFSAVSSNKTVLGVSMSGSKVTYEGLKEGSATVTVTAEDNGGLTATQQFDVEVDEPTRPCTIKFSDAALSVAENARVGTAMNRDVSVTASDCGTLRYALKGTGSDDFSVAAAGANDDDAKIKVAKRLNHEARDSYSLKLTVSSGSVSDTRDVDISVIDVNEAPQPVRTIRAQTVWVGDPVSVDVTGYFTDEDAGDRLTFTSKSSATGRLTVNAKGSPVTLTGVAAGSATVTVTARDRGNLTAAQTFSVTVLPKTTECGITVSKGALSVPEDARKGDGVDGEVGVTATAACGTLSYGLSGTGSENFTVAAAGSGDDAAKLRVAGTLDHETTASYALKLTVSSGTVSAEGDVGITVTDVNEAPVIDSAIPAQSVVTGKSESVVVSSRFSDPDGDVLTYLASSSNRNVATVSLDGGTVVVRGVAKGSAEVTVTARDPGRLEISQKFSVTVTDPPPTNGAPKIESAIPAQEVVAGESVTVVVSSHFSDPDNDPLTYLAESLNETVATVSVSDDKVVVRGVAQGRVEVKVTARDPHAEEISQRFSVTVKPANAAPVAASEIPAMTVAAGESKTVDVSAHFRDPDDDELEYEASSSNEAAATVGVEGSELKVTGVLRGESRVTVTARDPDGAKASQSFLVTVPNEAPEPAGTIPALTLSKGDTGSVRVSAHFSDAESDALTYRASSSNGGVLSVTVTGEHVSYEALKVGTSRVTVTADDGHGGTAD